MSKIKKGDVVIIETGKDKGKQGKILRIFTKAGKVLVEGTNLVKKAVKPNPQLNEKGGIKTQEAPIDISNIALINPNTGKAGKVGYKVIEGKKVRVFKADGQRVDN